MSGESAAVPSGAATPEDHLANVAPDAMAARRRRFEQESAAVAAAPDRASFEALRLRWTGRKQGEVTLLLQSLGRIPAEAKREAGAAINALKREVEAALEDLEVRVGAAEEARRLASSALDVTLPGRRPALGSLHPVTVITRELETIFGELGWSVALGPEIETEFHNFEALNIPEDHPARDSQDTFFMADGHVLRTHTSPVQIRTLLTRKPPIRVLCPGRVFRNDNDLRHSPMFHQVEGLCVGEGVTVGDLKGTLEAFLRRLFRPETEVRLRPSFFPFTEPSAEVDITCQLCLGKGCPTCSQTGWMEILGCGMVDPRVLRACGVDADRYSGFAFGMGLDRVAMNRFGIPNIRTLFENDERLLRQVQDRVRVAAAPGAPRREEG
jgi:phenylalanyl-tRNA synthetase alpha chain